MVVVVVVVAIHGWQGPLVLKSSDEMHGMILCKSLLSMDGIIKGIMKYNR